eukprot:m.1009 g.1009  ORF g.1009 m.1009 type:complete len:321 (+) comp5448_c0_seq1:2-964(+)
MAFVLVLFATLLAVSLADHHLPCASANIVNRTGFDNCLKSVSEELKSSFSSLPFVNNANFSVQVTANWTTPLLQFRYCDCNFTMKATQMISNPLVSGKTAVPASQLRVVPKLTFNFFNDTYRKGNYTLIFVDPYAVSFAGTFTRPYNHYTVINFDGTDVNTGTSINPYQNPGPPAAPCKLPHYYFLLLFKQAENIQLKNLSSYNPQPVACPSCLFEVMKFIASQNLTLIGATWQNVQFDPFVGFNYQISNFSAIANFKCSSLKDCKYVDPPATCPTTSPSLKSTPAATKAADQTVTPSGAQGYFFSWTMLLIVVASIFGY